MVEIHDVALDKDDVYKIRYKRTLKDVDGNDVTIFSDAHLKSAVDVQAEIDNLTNQKTNIENRIVKLQTELSEIAKVSVGP